MKKYDVPFTITINGFVTVEADDEVEAVNMVECITDGGIPYSPEVVIVKQKRDIAPALEVFENEEA